MNQRFDADAVAAEVGSRLWRYLSAASTISDFGAVAENLFALPHGELARLTAAHLAESESTGHMLDVARRVLRDLPASVDRGEVETRNRVLQPVIWSRTRQRRYATGDRQRFVCRPPERAYDTALARLVALALDRCTDLPELAGLGRKGELGNKVGVRAAEAKRLRGHVKLREVRRVNHLPDRTLHSLQRHRVAQPIIDWVRLAGKALDDRTPSVVREVIQERLLPPSRSSSLFELFVGFRLIDALVASGFSEVAQRLVPNSRVPFAKLQRGVETIEIYWQRPLWGIAEADHDGNYRHALEDAGLRVSPLKPDFVLRMRNPDRLGFVEVKLTEVENANPERRGIQDALLYAHDAESLFLGLPYPHGIVIAWNTAGVPACGRIVVADQGGIASAASALLVGWA